jgi:type IV pilus assembly protein PilA
MLARIRKSIEENDEGFTLIELLVVIIIIGILAAIAIPVFLHQRQKGYDAAAKSDLHQLANNEETYYVDHGRYGTAADLQAAGLAVTPSQGNAVLVYGSSQDGFCLGSTNKRGEPGILLAGSSGVIYWYDNQAGGLQSSETSMCPSMPSTGWTAMNGLWTNDWNGLNGYVGL